MNISDIKSLHKMPQHSIETICKNLDSVHIKKKRKILKQTELSDYFEKKNNFNLHKKKIYNKNNNMLSEKKYLLNLELENNSKINGTFIIKGNYNNNYELIPVTDDIKLKNNSEEMKIYKCIYNKEKDTITIQCGIKTIEQKIKECRGFNLKHINL